MRRAILIHIRTIEDFSIEDFHSLFEKIENFEFDDTGGYGFIKANEDDGYFSSTLVQRKLSYRTIFDPIANSFYQQESVYFERIPFLIDSEFGTVEVLSNATNARRAIAIFGQILDYQFSVADIHITPSRFLNLFSHSDISYILKKFSIDNFTASPGVSGTYAPEVLDTVSGISIIMNQEADVTKVTLKANFKTENDVELTFGRNGGLTIVCEEDNLTDLLREIKSLLFGGGENG